MFLMRLYFAKVTLTFEFCTISHVSMLYLLSTCNVQCAFTTCFNKQRFQRFIVILVPDNGIQPHMHVFYIYMYVF